MKHNKMKSYWDLLDYDIRKIVYSFIKPKPEREGEPTYKILKKQLNFEIQRESWVRWFLNLRSIARDEVGCNPDADRGYEVGFNPDAYVKQSVMIYIFEEWGIKYCGGNTMYPKNFIFGSSELWKPWKTPDATKIEIFTYKLNNAKTGATVKMNGKKIFRAYVRTREQMQNLYDYHWYHESGFHFIKQRYLSLPIIATMKIRDGKIIETLDFAEDERS